MSTRLVIRRAGPLVTIQDQARFNALRYGISASGPMDRAAFTNAAGLLPQPAPSGLEFTMAGLAFDVQGGPLKAGFGGGIFGLKLNGKLCAWPCQLNLSEGDRVEISPGPAGNYGYVRFDRQIDVPELLGSRATNLIVGLGGLEGRALKAGDSLDLVAADVITPRPAVEQKPFTGTIRVIWGLHADLFSSDIRQRFIGSPFTVSPQLDRMGVRLKDTGGVFADSRHLSLISDSVVPGDIQILGDGTPIVLMRDHQPTGGYPRIATVISQDFDLFAQLRPGTELRFVPVTVEHAQSIRE